MTINEDIKNSEFYQKDLANLHKDVFDKIFRGLLNLKLFLNDPCPCNDYWCQIDCFDSLVDEWEGNDLVHFINPIFSKIAVFMIRCLKHICSGNLL